MVKKCLSFYIISLLILLFPAFAAAQTVESSVSQTLSSSEHAYVQKIEWEGDENAWQYEVQIVSLENLMEPQNFVTDQTFITFTLPPGKYKYKVAALDLFGHVAVETKWTDFEISKAEKPLIGEVEDTVINGRKKKVEIPVEIENVSEDSTIVLINQETNQEVKAEFTLEKTKDNEQSVVKKLIVPKLEEGNWQVKVTNPGGKSTISDDVSINIEEKAYNFKNINIQAQAGYPYFLPVNESIKMLDNPLYLDFGARISVVPLNLGRNHIGFEAAYAWDLIFYKNEMIHISLKLSSVQANFLYQFELLDNTLYMDARLGWGVTVLQAFASGAKDYDFNKSYLYASINGGTGLMYKPFQFMNIELGAQTSVIFTAEDVFVAVIPMILVGVSF